MNRKPLDQNRISRILHSIAVPCERPTFGVFGLLKTQTQKVIGENQDKPKKKGAKA